MIYVYTLDGRTTNIPKGEPPAVADINLTPGAHAKNITTATHPKTGETVVLRTHAGDIPSALWSERTSRAKEVKLPSIAAIRRLQSTPNGYIVGHTYIPGELLSDAKLTPAEADEAVKTIAETVAALHANGAMHGNIHPRQFRMSPDGKTPVLLDSGWFWSNNSENYGTGTDIAGIKQTAGALNLSPQVSQAVAGFSGGSARELAGVIADAIKASEVSIDDDMFAGFGAPVSSRPAAQAPVAQPPQAPPMEETPIVPVQTAPVVESAQSAPVEPEPTEEEVVVAAPNPNFRPKAFIAPAPSVTEAPQAQPTLAGESGEESESSPETKEEPALAQPAPVVESATEHVAEPIPTVEPETRLEPAETPASVAVPAHTPPRVESTPEDSRREPAPVVETEPENVPETEPYLEEDQEQTVEETTLGAMFDDNDAPTHLDDEYPHESEQEPKRSKPGRFGAILPTRKREKNTRTAEPTSTIEHEEANGSVPANGKKLNRRTLLIGGGTLAALGLGALAANTLKDDNENEDQATASETPAISDETMAIPAGYQSTGNWTISVPEGAQVVANNAAVVLLTNKVMSLYSVSDGKKIRDIKLNSNSATVDETNLADKPGLVIRDGENRLLYWDTAKGAKGELVDEKIDANSKIKNSGIAPYIVEDKTVRGITTGGLKNYKVPDNNAPITFDGKTLYSGIVGTPVTLSKPSGATEKVINLAAPKDGLQMNQWVAVGNGTALTAWSEKGDETDEATPVTVAVNSLETGKLTDSYESTLGQIKNSKWVKGQGGYLAGLGNFVINLEKGKVARRLPDGMNVTAIKGDLVTGTDSSSNSYIFQGDNPGYVLSSTLRAQTGASVIVQQGSSLVAYPSTLS